MRPQGSWLTPALGATALRMPYQEVACASPAASRVVVMDWAAPTAAKSSENGEGRLLLNLALGILMANGMTKQP